LNLVEPYGRDDVFDLLDVLTPQFKGFNKINFWQREGVVRSVDDLKDGATKALAVGCVWGQPDLEATKLGVVFCWVFKDLELVVWLFVAILS
jgi:hypothetical protein